LQALSREDWAAGQRVGFLQLGLEFAARNKLAATSFYKANVKKPHKKVVCRFRINGSLTYSA
jgi:hypothetical protein